VVNAVVIWCVCTLLATVAVHSCRRAKEQPRVQFPGAFYAGI